MRVTVPVGNTEHHIDLRYTGDRDGKRVWAGRCRLPMQGVFSGALVVQRDAPAAPGAGAAARMAGGEADAARPMVLEGIASSTSVDWHGTEMTREALDAMALQMAAGVPYVPAHNDDEWMDVMGRTVEARVEQGMVVRDGGTKGQADGYRLAVRVELYPDHPKAQALMQAVERGQVVGMSIGGWFTDAEVTTNENDEVDRIFIKAVELDHLAVTRRPSNPDSWIGGLHRSTTQAFSAARALPQHALESAAARAAANLGGLVQRDAVTVVVGDDDADEAETEANGTVAEGDSCPVATQDIPTNLANRQHAIDRAGYGPANPDNPGDFWDKKAQAWQATVEEARSMVCGNCSLFNTTTKVQNCITQGIGGPDAAEVEREGAFGFCEAFDFKCSAKRTCAAWVVGGPFDDAKAEAAAAATTTPSTEQPMATDESATEAAATRGTFLDAPNYRYSNIGTQVCNRCEYYTRDGWCKKFGFAAHHEYVCDAYQVGTTDDIMAGGAPGHAPATQAEADAENAERTASGNTQFPLAPENTPWSWDASDANAVLGDPPNWRRFASVHAWYDESAPEVRGSYKLAFAKVIDGSIHIVWRGVAAAMGALLGARGGVDLPADEKEAVYRKLTALYARFDKEPPALRSGDTGLDNAGSQGSTATSQSDAAVSAELPSTTSEENAMTDNSSTATDTKRLDSMERAIGELHGAIGKLVERVAPTTTEKDEATTLREQLEAANRKLERALTAAGRAGVAHSPHAARHTDVGGHAPLIRSVERTLGTDSALVQVARAQAERRDSHKLQSRAELETDLRSLLTAAFADGIINDTFGEV